MPALKPAIIGQNLLTDCGQNRPLTTKYRELEDLEADFIEKNDLLEAGNDKKVIDYLYTIDHKGHKDIWC